jgi:O-antigen ligase
METITVGEQERDRSAQSRIEVWRAAFAMFGDYPWGVGPGNFAICISPYHSYEEGLRRDAHNAWIRCMGELGVQGLLALACVVGGAILTLVKVRRQAKALPPALGADVLLVAYGMALSLLVFLLGGLTWTNLYTEALWWWLALPVCLMRAVQNAEAKVRVPSSSPLGQHRALAKTSGAR